MATCNPSTLLQQGKDLQQLSNRDLQIVIAQLLCNLAASGTGGFQVGNGAPTGATPTTPPQYIDRVTKLVYYFYDGNWQ